jgi:hypothetical protein
MSRRKVLIPLLSILLFLATVLLGTYLVREHIAMRKLRIATDNRDVESFCSPVKSRPSSLNTGSHEGPSPGPEAVSVPRFGGRRVLES